MFYMETVKGSGKQQTVHKKVVVYPSGYSVLPSEGGWLDQPLRLTVFFDIFMAAERKIAFKKLNE